MSEKKDLREEIGAAFYTAPNTIVSQMKCMEEELDELYDKIRQSESSEEKLSLLARQKELEESMELMSQLLCFAKKV